VGPASFGVGLLSWIVGVSAIVLFTITCLLIPVGFLVGLGLILAGIFGWVVMGHLLGQRLETVFQQQSSGAGRISPTLWTLIGVFILTAVVFGLNLLGSLPCLGFFFWILAALAGLVVSSTGVGAVVLTRFGTQSYPGDSPSVQLAVPPVSDVSPKETVELDDRPEQDGEITEEEEADSDDSANGPESENPDDSQA
jgi:hypothetical protein